MPCAFVVPCCPVVEVASQIPGPAFATPGGPEPCCGAEQAPTPSGFAARNAAAGATPRFPTTGAVGAPVFPGAVAALTPTLWLLLPLQLRLLMAVVS